MRENITASARQRVAEGRASSAVHDVGRHHAEVQSRGHLKKQLKLIDLRLVLRSREVELDEAGHGLLTGPFADAQVRWLAAGRTNATGLDADLVESAVLRADSAKPVRRERIVDLAGKEEVTQRSLDAKTVQRRLLFLSATVTQISGGHTDLARIHGRGGRKGAVEHQLRRAVITIHMRRRERQLRPDALKSMPERVFIKLARLRRIIAHAQQIIDRVLILLPAQPIMRHSRPGRHPRRPAFF